MSRITVRSMAALALGCVAALVSGPVATAVTAEVRVVSDFTTEQPDMTYDPDTGWARHGAGTASVEIGSAYGAPAGLGRHAVMLDTPAAGDVSTLTALTDQPGYEPAFPGSYRASPDLRIGFWVYVSSQSADGSGPVLEGWVRNLDGGWGLGYLVATFDPVGNGLVPEDTWTFVDATDLEAVWSVRQAWADDPTRVEHITWAELIDRTRGGVYEGEEFFGGFEYGLSFVQDEPGTFSAIDGVTVSTKDWSSVTDFELRPTSGKPTLDRCKKGGWKANFPAGTFKNHGACIASITAMS